MCTWKCEQIVFEIYKLGKISYRMVYKLYIVNSEINAWSLAKASKNLNHNLIDVIQKSLL